MNSLIKEITAHSEKLPENAQQEIFDFIQFLENKLQTAKEKQTLKDKKNKDLEHFIGVLKNSPNFNEDPLVIQKQMRDEWG